MAPQCRWATSTEGKRLAPGHPASQPQTAGYGCWVLRGSQEEHVGQGGSWNLPVSSHWDGPLQSMGQQPVFSSSEGCWFPSRQVLAAKPLLQDMKTISPRCGTDMQNCSAQSSHSANVMSRNLHGVQALLQEVVPQALYVHCFKHRYNLVSVDACKGNKHALNFFPRPGEICVHFSLWVSCTY